MNYTVIDADTANKMIDATPVAWAIRVSDKADGREYTEFLQFTNEVYTDGPPKKDCWFAIAYEDYAATVGRRPMSSIVYTGTPGQDDRLPMIRTTKDDLIALQTIIDNANAMRNLARK